MTESFNFENLNVYRKALAFANFVYDITIKFPKHERFIITDQFLRAAISISLNIAEGYGGSALEFKRYLRIAKGSVRECIALITLARLRSYLDINQERILRNYCLEISRVLSGLIKSLIVKDARQTPSS